MRHQQMRMLRRHRADQQRESAPEREQQERQERWRVSLMRQTNATALYRNPGELAAHVAWYYGENEQSAATSTSQQTTAEEPEESS